MGCTDNGPGAPPEVQGAGESYEDFLNSYLQFGDEREALLQEDITSQRARLEGIMGLQDEFYSAAESPQDRMIRQLLGAQIGSELSMGARLDPSLRREVEQSVRGGQTARGMGRGRADLAEEVYAVGSRAEQLRRNRQQAAQGYLQNQAATLPGIMQLMGGQGATGLANFSQVLPGAMQQNQQAALMNAQNQYNYQQQQAARKAQQMGGLLKLGSGDAMNLTGVQEGGQNMYYGY